MTTRIIVAEDDTEMRKLVVDTLREDDREIIEVPDGGRLLVLIAQCCREDAPPDLIVSDVRMPVMTGLAMLKGVRDAHWTIPVVLMTAFPDADTKWRAASLAATVLAKPFPMRELREVVDLQLASGRPSRPTL
jgi:DNA-binding response OmpR family regulator